MSERRRSRRRSPGGPSTIKVRTPSGRPSQPTAGTQSSRPAELGSGGGCSTAKQACRNRARPGPVLNAFAESEAQPHLSRPHARPSRRLATHSTLQPKSHQPPDQTPLVGSHLVSVHPPCSRKGPLLPACGLKCPRRVKRETTNSRFCVLRGLGEISGGLHRPTDHLQSPAVSGEAWSESRQEERQERVGASADRPRRARAKKKKEEERKKEAEGREEGRSAEGRNKRKKKENHSTQDSHVVPHHGTNWAALRLTAQIGRDAVLSESYGRGYWVRGRRPKCTSSRCRARGGWQTRRAFEEGRKK